MDKNSSEVILDKNNKKLFFYTILFFLAFSWTNLIYVVALIVPFSFLIGSVYFRGLLSKLQLYLLLLFLYCIVSVLVVHPTSLLEFGFYRRDGNLFISLLPLLMIGFIHFQFNSYNFIRRFIILCSIANIVFFIFFLIKGNNIFANSTLYYFAFTAHNAAGGFLMILSCLSVAVWYFRKNTINAMIALLNISSLFATGSRGSYLAFILAIFFVFLLRYRYIFLSKIAIISIILLHIGIIIWGYTLHHSIWNPEDKYASDVIQIDVRDSHNISYRMIKVWPWAIDDFLESPIFGTGFSTFNDHYIELKKIAPLINLRILEENIYNSGHAHHSFLHILAEMGIIGILLIFLILKKIYQMILRLPDFDRMALLLCFFALLFASLTEHRLVTPSQALPFFTILAMIFSNNRFNLKHHFYIGKT
jgi:O-antigen ligase